jgi:hypothetical protein
MIFTLKKKNALFIAGAIASADIQIAIAVALQVPCGDEDPVSIDVTDAQIIKTYICLSRQPESLSKDINAELMGNLLPVLADPANQSLAETILALKTKDVESITAIRDRGAARVLALQEVIMGVST